VPNFIVTTPLAALALRGRGIRGRRQKQGTCHLASHYDRGSDRRNRGGRGWKPPLAAESTGPQNVVRLLVQGSTGSVVHVPLGECARSRREERGGIGMKRTERRSAAAGLDRCRL
jgi:hypothetical protein